jgi:hypothetical protein
MKSIHGVKLYFSDFFEVAPSTIQRYGAFNISLVSDLPLFIDPFLLFNSQKRVYRNLHDQIIKYLLFLKEKSGNQRLDAGLIKAWYAFPEIKQNWLGFSLSGNRGRGLGGDFARALYKNLHLVFSNFGDEQISQGTHLEKLCLVDDGVGKDSISDFTTNLIHGYLLEYTEKFAQKHIDKSRRMDFVVSKSRFNYRTETWERKSYNLPYHNGNYVLLCPRDMLTKDDTWINKTDLIEGFERIPEAIPNDQLRAQINNYFRNLLPKEPKKKDETDAARETILHYPELLDYYIKYKEETGDQAVTTSEWRVDYCKRIYFEQFRELSRLLLQTTEFYKIGGNTYDEAKQRVEFLRDVVENKSGHRIFYADGQPIQREEDVHILYRLTFFGTPSDVSREVNDGRGPADFKLSRGSQDKCLVEFKLASNTQIKRNLQHQTKIYEKASDAKRSIKVIFFFSETEELKVNRVLKELNLIGHPDIVLVDARMDNKPSGSRA